MNSSRFEQYNPDRFDITVCSCALYSEVRVSLLAQGQGVHWTTCHFSLQTTEEEMMG